MSCKLVIPCQHGLISLALSKQVSRTYSDSKGSEMLPVLLLRLTWEELGEEGYTIQRQVERVDVVLGKVCGTNESAGTQGWTIAPRTSDTKTSVTVLLTRRRLELSNEEFEPKNLRQSRLAVAFELHSQCTLSSSVGPDDT